MRDGDPRIPAGVTSTASVRRDWPRLVALIGAILAVVAFRDIGRDFYAGFSLPQGSGMNALLPAEISAFAVYIVFGSVAWGLLAAALAGTAPVEVAVRALRAAAGRPAVATAALAVLLGGACATLAHFQLRHAATSDDEHVYRFIAQTLSTGRLIAPSPGTDLDFYREQFVVLTDLVRFGKYPIGFPALLALGQKLGIESAVVPLIVALLVVATACVARQVTTAAGALVALLLFALSPQVLSTGATLLSQPASALCSTIAVAALLAAGRGPGRAGAAVLAGAALGYGILVRPLPGVLFVVAAGGWLAWITRAEPPPPRARLGLALGLPVLLAGAVLLAGNRLQVGRALTSGYQAFHATGEGLGGLHDFVGGTIAQLAMSVFASLFRLDVWLFGWPVSLLLLPFARRTGPYALLWAIVAAELAYRVVSPKAGVGGTGPVYFFEAVPILSVLSADGALRAGERLGRVASSLRTAVAPVLIAGTVVAYTLFVPDRLADLGRMAQAQRVAADLVARRGLAHVLVFHEGVVPPWTYRSWAYFPRINSPSLDDDVLYVRFQRAGGALDRNLEFWRRRHPDRSAWYFGWPPGGEPFLVDLESFVRREAESAR